MSCTYKIMGLYGSDKDVQVKLSNQQNYASPSSSLSNSDTTATSKSSNRMKRRLDGDDLDVETYIKNTKTVKELMGSAAAYMEELIQFFEQNYKEADSCEEALKTTPTSINFSTWIADRNSSSTSSSLSSPSLSFDMDCSTSEPSGFNLRHSFN